MWTCRIVGWGLLLLAAAALGWDVFGWALKGSYQSQLSGEFWAAIHRPSLNLVQAVIQRYVLPELWDYVILPILLAPLWLVPAVPGLLLAVLCRHRLRTE